MTAQYAHFAIAAILIAAMLIELRTARIPNWLTLLPLFIFVDVLFFAEDRTPLYWQMGFAALVFVVGIVLFIFAGFGAGAVKLMSGLALFIPLEKGGYTLLIFFVAFFVVSFLIVQIRKVFASPDSKWPVLARPIIPTSLPIGIAGLAGLFLL